MAYVIAEPCIGVKDRGCVEVCPVDCIYEADDLLYIHPEECIDCGACQPVCPVEAIFESPEAVPDKWKQYTQMNADLSHSPPKGRNMLPKDWAAAGGKTT